LDGEGLDLVDYWEVDPNWDGQIFRSAVQAVRPLRDGAIQTYLAIPAEQQGKIIGRVVDIAGHTSRR
jgi:hypothetical protein